MSLLLSGLLACQTAMAATPTAHSLHLPIMFYHYVEHVQNVKDVLRQRMDTKPELFEEQLMTLRNGSYTTVFLRDAGFAIAVTTHGGSKLSAKHILTLPRVRAGTLTGKHFLATLQTKK